MAEARSGVHRTATLPHGEANILPRGRVRRALLGPSEGSRTALAQTTDFKNAPASRRRTLTRASEVHCFKHDFIPAEAGSAEDTHRVPVLGYRGRRSLP